MKKGDLIRITLGTAFSGSVERQMLRDNGPLWVIVDADKQYSVWAKALTTGERHWWFNAEFEHEEG